MKITSHSGFTLIELLLYISCAAIMLTTVSIFLSFLLRARVHSQIIAEVDGQGRQVMTIITQLVRNAIQITAPAAQGSGASLSFTVPNGAKSPAIVSVINGTLTLTEGNNAPVALTNNRVIASGVDFKNLSRAQTPGAVELQFILTHVNQIGRSEFAYAQNFIGAASIR